jgi:ribosome-binding protein aMBF1 (putative translation factor)
MDMDGQDWATVKITASKFGAHAATAASKQPPKSAGAAQQARVAESEGPVHVKLFTADSVAAIQAYRKANGLKQTDLDSRLALPKGTVNGLEARKMTPTPKIHQSLNRLTQVALKTE